MIDVAILGATGTVGQKFITLLQNHPQFKIREIVASEKSAGNRYKDICMWKQHCPIPDDIANMTIQSLQAPLESKILFSGLDSSVAFDAEKQYASLGHIVISNSKNHRMEPQVPLVIPEINYEHLSAIKSQDYAGAIITNPNCSTIGAVPALAPLHEKFTIKKIIIHTMQAISGAGYPGIPASNILGNVIPFVDGEENKIETEILKILGTYADNRFIPASIVISAHCNRVPVMDGHTENISVAFEHPPEHDEIIQAWKTFRSFPQEHNLYMAPESPIWYYEQDDRPQPALDILKDKGMATHIGRLRKCPVLDYKFTILSHNTIRGAAGTAILNAETLIAMNLYIK